MNPLIRPERYGDCLAAGLGAEHRPCPHTSCSMHTGQLPHTCTLRVADYGGATQDEVAPALGIDRTRVRQIERRALEKITEDRPMTHVARRERGVAA